MQDVEDVTAWAKTELPSEAEESQWSLCTGIVLESCDHLDAALSKYQQAADMKPDLWRARQKIATALSLKGEFQDAISTMNELLERENWRLDSDEQYAREYWDNMLPSIVTWNLRLNKTTAAEDVSKKIVERVMKQNSFTSSAKLNVKTLMEIQVKQRKHSEVVDLLEELSDRVDLESNWLIKMMYSFHSEFAFHDLLLGIGKNADYSTNIIELYQAAIDGASSITSTISKEVKLSLPIRLRTMQAKVMWHLGTEEQRDAALSMWEEILRTMPDEEDINFGNIIWSRRVAIGLVGPALVTAALEKSSLRQDDEIAAGYLQRLEALQSVDHATGRHPASDVRVPLARMLILLKQTERARKVIRDCVALTVQLLEESAGDNLDACDRLVNTFLALEDNVNATAASTLYANAFELDFSCSTIGCDSRWNYTSDMYACRDCYSPVCPSCYEALREGTDTKTSCHKLHSHLYFPPVDAQKLIDRPKDVVWVEGTEVPLQQWLDSIKNDWGLEQRSVRARERWITAMRRITNSLALKPDRHDSTSSNS